MPQRLEQLRQWLQQQQLPVETLRPVAGDASFRRYFRIHRGDQSWIIMDAPPDKEPLTPFIRVAELLHRLGVHVPLLEARQLERGFLLLSDLGDRLYLGELTTLEQADRLYGEAITTLLAMQRPPITALDPLPHYTAELLQRELDLFHDWFLVRHLGLTLDEPFQPLWQEGCRALIASALAQPQRLVHRDYHSRNLLYHPTANPGVIDFQDAVIGPVSYDLVSLLRDCYIRWPAEQVMRWLEDYRQQAVAAAILTTDQAAHLPQWFDWMGVQRHMKAIGIFSRLYHRDGKAGYLGDIPRTWSYLAEVMPRYGELEPLWQVLKALVPPEIKPSSVK